MVVGSSIAADVIKDCERLSNARGNWDSHWTEIAERMIPSHSRLFQSAGPNRTQGEKRNEQLFDSTAAIALNRFASILDSLLTPRNQTWHRLMVSDRSLARNREVTLWFEEVNRLLFKYRYAPKANFASQNQMTFKSVGAFGTGALFVDELKGPKGPEGIRYRNISLGEIYFDENHQGIVDTAHRKFNLTARQALQKFGEVLPATIKECVKTHPDREFTFIHCVKPREDMDSERVDYKGMPWASYYVSIEGQTLLSEGGYNTFPYPIPRYEQVSGEIYGRSPAMEVLPAVKTLNEQKKTILKQGHRAVDPVLLAADDGIVDTFSLRPGAINAGGVSSEGKALVHALPVGNIAVGKDLMDDERAVINDAFLVTLFQILTETPTMTATEVLERTREKGILLAPTIGRQQSEYLGPLIERELDLLAYQRVLPPMPQALIEARGEYRIEYDSPLSRAQRAEEAAGLMRTIETALSVVNVTQDMQPLDHFNWDLIIPEVASIQGVPSRWMRAVEQVASIREGRAQAAQNQEMIQAAPGAAAMMNAQAKMQKGK